MKPVDKEKKRYVLFEIVSESNEKFSFKSVEAAILNSCRELLGEIFMGEAGIQIFEEKFDGQKGVIRVNTKWVKYLKTCLGNIYQIDNKKISIHVPKVSGLINKLG